jgi:hypothetical protein
LIHNGATESVKHSPSKHREAEEAFLAAVLIFVGLTLVVVSGGFLGWIALHIDYQVVIAVLVMAIVVAFFRSRELFYGLLLVALIGVPVAALTSQWIDCRCVGWNENGRSWPG